MMYIIWVNYNNSLTWIKAIWGWFPLLTMIPVRSQWGHYNLPRYDWYMRVAGIMIPVGFFCVTLQAGPHSMRPRMIVASPDVHTKPIWVRVKKRNSTIQCGGNSQQSYFSPLKSGMPTIHHTTRKLWMVDVFRVFPTLDRKCRARQWILEYFGELIWTHWILESSPKARL